MMSAMVLNPEARDCKITLEPTLLPSTSDHAIVRSMSLFTAVVQDMVGRQLMTYRKCRLLGIIE